MLRLVAVVAVAVTILSLAGMVLQYRLVQARLMAGAQAVLAADLDGLAALYDQRRIIALRQAIEYRAVAATGAEMLWLGTRSGGMLAGTRADWPAGLMPAGEGFAPGAAQVFEAESARWLGVARVLPGGFPLLVARSLAGVDATLAALRRAMAAITAGMLALGVGVGWLAARGPMARIGALNALSDRVAGGDLSARLPGPRSADEFGLLETHVHAMLDRIEALNRATHRLSDSIAHELRTPLNRMAAKLDRVQGQPDLVADLRVEMRAAVRVFDALLDISRAEADTGGGGLVPTDLSALAAEMAELYAPLVEEAGMTLTADLAPGQMVLGDRTLIGQMLANLLDNAVKYCRPGDRIALTLADLGQPVLTLADTGPGLPPDLASDAFERFTRGAPHGGLRGHGLGLALVRAIATRHGARLSQPTGAKGFALEIRWPRLPPT
ncbi:MAG: ATP-binding protein [Gemmobacter sp.]